MATNVARGGERGDTLIEVLMALVILSIVIVGTITIMSRGLAAAQIAVEHTQVRLHINSQTELLRYLRDGYVKDPVSPAGQTWLGLVNGTYVNETVSTYNADTCVVTAGKSGFYADQGGAGEVVIRSFDSSVVPAAAAVPGQGLWVEATRSESGITPGYIDFQIRACWAGGGSNSQQQTVTAVRLYDPTR